MECWLGWGGEADIWVVMVVFGGLGRVGGRRVRVRVETRSHVMRVNGRHVVDCSFLVEYRSVLAKC